MPNIKELELRYGSQVKVFRNSVHKWAALNPFTFGTITLGAGLVIGLMI